MSTVLFTHSYFYRLDPKQWRFKQPYPPLATILAAAVVREAGFKASLFDASLAEGPADVTAFLQREHPKYFVIYDDGFNYLTKMCLTNMRQAAQQVANKAKRLGCTVIICSSDSTDHYEKYFPFGVDYVIRGEGEITLRELLGACEKRGDASLIPGLAFRKHGETVVTPGRAVARDLDAFPLPAWDLIDVDSYRKVWKKFHGHFSLNIATTRGCPYKCNWCAKPIYGNRYNSRSPQHVVRELQHVMKEFRPDHIWFCDDIFGLKPGWLAGFRTLIETHDLRFKYKIQSRADLLVEPSSVEHLAASGAQTVWLGAESGSQKILDAMDKGTTVDQIRVAAERLRESNIRVAFFLQFGYPGETREDIDKTLELVMEVMPDEVGISISYPLPGTKFYDMVKDQLREKENWSDSDDLDMMFAGTFNSAYYRLLHKYVHATYQKEKGFNVLKKLVSSPLRVSSKELRTGVATLY
jgi:anaerobic magnesium-protoporphyrin IX monomethyl ester cyclase